MKKDSNPKSDAPWSVPVAAEDIPEGGLNRAIEAPPDARAALAALADVRAVQALSADFDLTRLGASVYVSGQVRARVVQTCVVTLEPVENEVDERVDLIFAPGPAGGAAAETAVEVKSLDPADGPPEPLVDGKVDLGVVATEFLILGIDPYPRKPDAQFAPPAVDEPGEHPFAVLAALKKRSGGGRS